jgi:hypothetical protein
VLCSSMDAAQTWVRQALLAHEIIIECCPTSNVWIGRTAWFDLHPFTRFIANGLSATVNTDNPGFFETDVSFEEELLVASAQNRTQASHAIAQARDRSSVSTASRCGSEVDWSHVRQALRIDGSRRDRPEPFLPPFARSRRRG